MSSTTTTWSTDTNTKSGSATTYTDTVSSLKLVGVEGGDAILRLFADEGDDNADQWRIVSQASTNKLNFMSFASGAWSTVLDLYGAGGAVVLNEDSADIDFRVEGNGDANLLFCDAGNDRIGIGTASPGTKLQVDYNGGHTTGVISYTNATLDLYNPLEANTDEKGSILTFSDNFYTSGSYYKTVRAAIKGGTDEVDNDASGFLAFYTTTASQNQAVERARFDDDGHFFPSANNTYTCGAIGAVWADVRSTVINGADINLRSEEGDWSLREGHDGIYACNNEMGEEGVRDSGQWYKINMTAVSRDEAPSMPKDVVEAYKTNNKTRK